MGFLLCCHRLHLTVGTISSSAAQRFVHGIDFDALHDTFIEFEGSDDGASLIFFDDGAALSLFLSPSQASESESLALPTAGFLSASASASAASAFAKASIFDRAPTRPRCGYGGDTTLAVTGPGVGPQLAHASCVRSGGCGLFRHSCKSLAIARRIVRAPTALPSSLDS